MHVCPASFKGRSKYSLIRVCVSAARPDVHVLVSEETVGGIHYQSVSCSAVGGWPAPQIGWLVNNLPPSGDPFTVATTTADHPNGTATVSSTLRFPTHLQDEESITCAVHHPTLPDPKLTTVGVKTYSKVTPSQNNVCVCVFVFAPSVVVL